MTGITQLADAAPASVRSRLRASSFVSSGALTILLPAALPLGLVRVVGLPRALILAASLLTIMFAATASRRTLLLSIAYLAPLPLAGIGAVPGALRPLGAQF